MAIRNEISLNQIRDLAADTRFVGKISSSAGPAVELTAAQATALLDTFSTSSTTKGLVPGSNNLGAGYFLQADLTWAQPPASVVYTFESGLSEDGGVVTLGGDTDGFSITGGGINSFTFNDTAGSAGTGQWQMHTSVAGFIIDATQVRIESTNNTSILLDDDDVITITSDSNSIINAGGNVIIVGQGSVSIESSASTLSVFAGDELTIEGQGLVGITSSDELRFSSSNITMPILPSQVESFVLYYNETTKEVSYGAAPSGGGTTTTLSGDLHEILKFASASSGVGSGVFATTNGSLSLGNNVATGTRIISSAASSGTASLQLQTSDFNSARIYLNSAVVELGSTTQANSSARIVTPAGTATNIPISIRAKGAEQVSLWGTSFPLVGPTTSYGQYITTISTSAIGVTMAKPTAGGEANFSITAASGISTNVNGANITVTAGSAYNTTGNGNGGNLTLVSGQRRTAGSGTDGNIVIDSLTGDVIFTSALDNDDALDQVLVRDSGTGIIKYRTAASLIGGGGGGLSDGDKGDITVAGGGTTWTIDPQAVSYSKIQNISNTNRFLGRISSGAGVIEELTMAQATGMLDLFTSTAKGLVSAPGITNTGKFLRGDNTWQNTPDQVITLSGHITGTGTTSIVTAINFTGITGGNVLFNNFGSLGGFANWNGSRLQIAPVYSFGNTVETVLSVEKYASDTVSAGSGAAIDFVLETSTNNVSVTGRIVHKITAISPLDTEWNVIGINNGLQQTFLTISEKGLHMPNSAGTVTVTADTAAIYVKDIVAGNAAVHVKTENGQEIKLYQVNAGSAYTVTNSTTDRTYDANSTTMNELADVVATLIADLKLTGIIA